MGTFGRDGADAGVEGGREFLASRLQYLRQSVAHDAARARHPDQTQPGRRLRVSLWRRLLEQAAQPHLPLRGRTRTAVQGLRRRRLYAARLRRQLRLLVGAGVEQAVRLAQGDRDRTVWTELPEACQQREDQR